MEGNSLEDRIQEIRDKGFILRIRHDRVMALFGGKLPSRRMSMYEYRKRKSESRIFDYSVYPKGGSTTAEIIVKEGDEETVVAKGVAVCRDDEQFVRRAGVDLAVHRARTELSKYLKEKGLKRERVSVTH